MKKIVVVIAILTLTLCFAARAEGALSVVAANFPCYDFASQVAGERAEVSLLIQPGVEVHAFDPTPTDILRVGEADLFVYIGGESDAWADAILESFGGGVPATLRLMDAVEPIEEEGEEPSGEPEYDEHIWTSPVNAAAMVRAVADALCALDPDGEAVYRENAAAYIAEIDEIDASIRTLVDGAARRELVFADRFPFLYLVREYGLDYIAAFPSCTADTEVSPKTLMAIIDRVREDGVPVVYTIEMSAQNIARTVSEETGAGIETLHSMQTVTLDEFNAGATYVSLMKANVIALEKGLM